MSGPDPYPRLRILLRELQTAHAGGFARLCQYVEASTKRLADRRYADPLRSELRTLLRPTDATRLLTEGGVLSSEGLLSGILGRIGDIVAPPPPKDAPLARELRRLPMPRSGSLWRNIPLTLAAAWTKALLAGDEDEWEDPAEIASAMVILATRIAGAGLDPRITERLPPLHGWQSPFIELSRSVDRLAELYVARELHAAARLDVLEAVRRCREQVVAFRDPEGSVGTTLYLSGSSLRMLQQLRRLRHLVEALEPDEGPRAVAAVALQLLEDLNRRHPIAHFVREKLDQIAYLVVGHAAQRGEQYEAWDRGDTLRFIVRSLFGGLLVGVFACLKIHLSHEALAAVPQALVYGMNYAICFLLIYLFGATLATKQPAFTASRLAASLEDEPSDKSFAYLFRAIWRGQFISLGGNIVGASLCAIAIASLFSAVAGEPLVSPPESELLADRIHPLRSGSVFYAAVAGVMLSAAGLLAAFVDNSVVFHRIGDRLRGGGGLFRFLSPKSRASLAQRVERSLGGWTGNVVLGFMLGSAGTFGEMLGLPFDIRHIAFASSHAALGLWHTATWGLALYLALAVLIIGLVNFAVSFLLTLGIAVTSRGISGLDWRRHASELWALLKSGPVQFFLPIEDEARPIDLA